VDRKGVTQTGTGHAPVQQREIRRMKDRIADAGDDRRGKQARIARRQRQHQTGDAQRADAEHQHRARADPVDHESGQRLADAADDEEHGHQKAGLGVGQREVRHQPREQRRQHQVEEVRRAVRQPDQADHFGIAPARCVDRGCTHGGDFSKGAAQIMRSPPGRHCCRAFLPF
jgi:hypothetical protein